MDFDSIIKRFADMARPYAIYATGSALACGPFVHADFALMGITATAFGALIGARSTENVFQTQADRAVKTTTIQATSSQGATVTTATTEGVKATNGKETKP